MSDKLIYSVPFGIIGELANTLVVKQQTNDIFNHREKAVEKMFGVL